MGHNILGVVDFASCRKWNLYDTMAIMHSRLWFHHRPLHNRIQFHKSSFARYPFAVRTTNTTRGSHQQHGNGINSTQNISNRASSNIRPGSSSPMDDMVKSLGVGALAGGCGSLAGMGGGFVMIPLMTSSLLRLSQHTAHGTSLFAVAATGVAGALGYSGQVAVDVPSALAIASCGVFTARWGALATTQLSARTLQRMLGIFMLLVAPIVPAKQYLINYNMNHHPEEQTSMSEDCHNGTENNLVEVEQPSTQLSQLLALSVEHSSLNRLVPSAAIGIFSGFMAGLLGVGGGAVVVPALTLATDMTHYQALGTSLCAMSIPAMVGTFTHYRQGNVAMRVAPLLALGAFMGGYAGGKLGSQLNENSLRWGFSGLMVFLGVRTLLRA